jgi:hypothetical protein
MNEDRSALDNLLGEVLKQLQAHPRSAILYAEAARIRDLLAKGAAAAPELMPLRKAAAPSLRKLRPDLDARANLAREALEKASNPFEASAACRLASDLLSEIEKFTTDSSWRSFHRLAPRRSVRELGQ